MPKAKKQMKTAARPKRKAEKAPGKASRKVRETTRKAEGAEAMHEAGDGEKEAKKAKGKCYSIVEKFSTGQTAAFEKFEPMVKKFVESIREAGRPLTMAECAAKLSKVSKTTNPAKHASWIFCRRLRPAGLLVEERG
jgi:hypothetical protein